MSKHAVRWSQSLGPVEPTRWLACMLPAGNIARSLYFIGNGWTRFQQVLTFDNKETSHIGNMVR